MVVEADLTQALHEQVQAAIAANKPLRIEGGGSKGFLGRPCEGELLAVGGHRGVINYQPSELVFTARSGTPLAEVVATLDERGQMLPFEPPHFGETATIGGTVAAGLSGPRRPWTGAARDFVLGTRIINGRGQVLRLGGEVIKNVAGFDLSRLMAGAMGTLGVLLDISFKVLPKPRREQTLVLELSAADAIRRLAGWGVKPMPLSGACHVDGRLHVRLSGAESAVKQAREEIGGELLDDAERFWRDLREQQLDFFDGDTPLWRMSVPPATPPMDDLPDAAQTLMDWGGALRWVRLGSAPATVREVARRAGGHATLFRGGGDDHSPFQPLPEELMKLHKKVKQALDPENIFNRGKLYAEL